MSKSRLADILKGAFDNCLVVCSQPLEGIPSHVAEVVEDAFVVAVDGGLKHLRDRGIVPALWVGDGDSTKPEDLKKITCPKVKLPRAKDYTDLEYALHAVGAAFLEGVWEGSLVLLGAQGGRLDHELGNLLVVQHWLQDLSHAVGIEQCPSVASFGPRGMWVAAMDEIDFEQPKGALFSVMALTGAPKLTITGAKFNVRGKALDHASMGLSNEGTGKRVTVRVHQPRGKGGVASPVFVMMPNPEPESGGK